MVKGKKGKQIWCVYNHMPYGHMVATHFETNVRKRRNGDSTEEVTFTAENQLENFKRTEQVSLYTVVAGQAPKLEKNKVIVCPVDVDHPNPAGAALEYAASMGIQAVPDPKRKELPNSEIERVAQLEGRIAGIETSQNQMASALNSLADAIKGLTAANTKKGE